MLWNTKSFNYFLVLHLDNVTYSCSNCFDLVLPYLTGHRRVACDGCWYGQPEQVRMGVRGQFGSGGGLRQQLVLTAE